MDPDLLFSVNTFMTKIEDDIKCGADDKPFILLYLVCLIHSL